MNGNIGKQFLLDHIKQTEDSFSRSLEKVEIEAKEISKIPAELIRRFTAIALKGKRIRGALMSLGYSISGGKDISTINDASGVIEIFHSAVLVHDDIMDEDSLRRGLPTIHKQFEKIGGSINVNTSPLHYGESMAINVGDLGFYISWNKLLSSNFKPEYILACGKIYSDYVIRVVHGQVLDVTNTTIKSISERDILKVYKYKTAEYTGVLPMLMGTALSGNNDKEHIDAIIGYGTNFGWAFQIQDDILGMFGKEKKLGKPVGSDLQEGKNTLLMLYLYKHGTHEQKKFMKRVLGNRNITKNDLKKMQKILKEVGAYEYNIKLGWEYVEKGRSYINKITKDKKYQDILNSLITYMMERVK